MWSKTALAAITLIGFIVTLGVSYFKKPRGNVLSAALIFVLTISPAFLSFYLIQRLLQLDSTQATFAYNQTLFGAIPGLLTILAVDGLLSFLTLWIFFPQKFRDPTAEMEKSGKLLVWLALFFLLSTAVRETGKYLMGQRVKGALPNDSETLNMNLVLASFCAPVVGLIGMAALFWSFGKVMAPLPMYLLLVLFLQDILDCAADIGTALLMGLSACHRYVLGQDTRGYATLGIAILIRYFWALIASVVAFTSASSYLTLAVSLSVQLTILLLLAMLCRRAYSQLSESEYMPINTQPAPV